MKLYIWKYRDVPEENYFSGDCTFIDKIQINQVLELPTFVQEFNSETDFSEFKADNFTIRISRLSSDTSANGDSVESFLFPTNKDNKFLVVFQVKDNPTSSTDMLSSVTGLINLESIRIDCNQNGYYIEFTCIGIIREFAEYYDGEIVDAVEASNSPNYLFDTYIQALHFTSSTLWSLSNQLDMTGKTGDLIYISNPLQRDLVLGHATNLSQWVTFKDLAFQLGFSFRLIVDSTTPFNSNTPHFTLYLFWRSNGLQTVTPQILEHEKGISLKYNNKWVMIYTRQHVQGLTATGATRTDINGFLMNKDDVYNTDTTAGADNRPVFIVAETQGRFTGAGSSYITYNPNVGITGQVVVPFSDILFTNNVVNLYSIGTSFTPKISAGSITYSRILVTNFQYNTPVAGYYVDWRSDISSTPDVINLNTAIPEYRFLLSGVKETKRLKIIYDSSSNINLFGQFDLTENGNTKTFLIERISDINLWERTAIIDAIEV